MGCGQCTAVRSTLVLHTCNDDELDGGEQAGWETLGIDEPILLGSWGSTSSVRTRDRAMSGRQRSRGLSRSAGSSVWTTTKDGIEVSVTTVDEQEGGL